MMHKKKPGVDVIMDILTETQKALPASNFVNSLLFQYQERGGLSKKQLEGLYGKASKIPSITESKLATLQAIILKKHAKHTSSLPAPITLYTKDVHTGRIIEDILGKYPKHKAALMYKKKFDNNEPFTPMEKSEIERFKKLLLDTK